MSLTWADWIRYIFTPLIIASITSLIAIRNARKTPHERLKNLVEIHKNMPPNLDSAKVVESAIARELVDFDRRLATDQLGLRKAIAERIRQRSADWDSFVFMLAGACLLLWIVVTLATYGIDSELKPYVSAAISVGCIALVGEGFLRRQRHSTKKGSLSWDRAAAEVRAVVPRVLLQQIARDDGFSPADFDSDSMRVADRLSSAGVFNDSIARGGSAESYSLTNMGREIVKSVLADMDRQHIAHWRDIASESSETSRADDGDDGLGG